MIDKLRQHPGVQSIVGRLLVTLKTLVTYFSRFSLLQIAAAAIIFAAIYWGLVASDRYVSEAHIVINRTDLAASKTPDLASVLTGPTLGQDERLMRDHLLSVDMLNRLDAKLDLRAHYSDGSYDPWSRMWSAQNPQEWFHQYYLSRVSAEIDDLSGILVIRAEAFTPEMAHRIAAMLVEEGERYMNEMAHRLARDQVQFLEAQLVPMEGRLQQARHAVVSYQNQKGMVSPQATVANLSAIVGKLEGQIAELKARRQGMLGYLSHDAPDIVQLDHEIDALEKQMVQEQSRMASPKGQALNRTVEEYQRLQMEAEFAQEVYRTALAALERGRVEAIRTLRKVSVLQSPTLPQHPLEPRRLHNIITFALVALLLAGVLHLIAAIIRDHKD